MQTLRFLHLSMAANFSKEMVCWLVKSTTSVKLIHAMVSLEYDVLLRRFMQHQMSGAGQLIVATPRLSSMDECWSCHKGSAKRKCSACRVAAYCDQACQRAAWAEHKPLCAQIIDARKAANG